MTHRTGNPIIFRASTHQDDSNELSFVKFRIEEGGKRDRTFKKNHVRFFFREILLAQDLIYFVD